MSKVKLDLCEFPESLHFLGSPLWEQEFSNNPACVQVAGEFIESEQTRDFAGTPRPWPEHEEFLKKFGLRF
jgi:hypothetical protein